MDKIIDFKSENEKRKLSIHEKMKNGDEAEVDKFISLCKSPDEDDLDLIDQKINRVIETIDKEFDLEFIKGLDCTIIDEDLLELIRYSSNVTDMWQVGLYSELNDEFYVIPLILRLKDDTEIKLVYITESEEFDIDEDEFEDEFDEEFDDENKYDDDNDDE